MISSLVALAGLEIKASARRGIRVAALAGLAAIFTLAAIFYGFGALGEWLRLRYSPIEAQLILAGLALLVAFLATGIALVIRHAPRDRSASKEAMALVAAPLAVTIARKGLSRWGLVLPLVIASGFLVGRIGQK